MTINWDTQLPEEYETQVNDIYQQALGIVNVMKEKFARTPVNPA